jgi:hypothetical protein
MSAARSGGHRDRANLASLFVIVSVGEAIKKSLNESDCFVADVLAMTELYAAVSAR